jgi:tellurite methyltransferase
LFGRDELEHCFAGWHVLALNYQAFSAPENTEKVFATIIAEKI